MPFERFPHSGTITYFSGYTFSSVGVQTPNNAGTLTVAQCRVEENTTRWDVSSGGDKLDFDFTVFAPKMTAATIALIPIGAVFIWKNKDYKIVSIPDHQLHTEINII